jgi:beta-lactam-binding protein with PASTA domain
MSMSRKSMLFMALILALATAATAATAFAGTKKKLPEIVQQQVVDAVTSASDAARNAKVRMLRIRPNTAGAPLRAGR